MFNRNRFDELYSKEIKRAKRYENNLSIILFDIDDFKNVNDNYGHQIGDEVLIEISKILLNNVREPDICVRWGGEEFLILLPQTNLEGAKAVAEKIRVIIIEKPLTEKNLPISASFGVCQMDENDDDFSLISKSDKLLYLAKKSGKNIVIAQ